MPFNGSGVFQRVRNWVADATAGVKIRADYHDSEDDNFAAGLTNCITKDGQTVVTQNIPMNSKRITGLADAINPQDAATKAQLDTKMSAGGGTVSGGIEIHNGAVDGAEVSWASEGYGTWSIDNHTGTLRFFQGSTVAMSLPDGAGSLNVVHNINAGGTIHADGVISGPTLSISGNISGGAIFGSSLNVSSGAVTCGSMDTGPITAVGPVTVSGGITVGNGIVYLNAAHNKYLYWNGTNIDLSNSAAAISLMANNNVQLANGWVNKAGTTGGYGASSSNIFWDNVGVIMFIDNINKGYIQIPSDYRIKKDVIDLPGMWDTVKALRPIKYTQAAFDPPAVVRSKADQPPMYQEDDIERWGFIAHELQETLTPSAANGVKDSPDTVQAPNWPTVVAALTKALQEAMSRIEALEAR